jgi:hypothetical protein
MNCFKIADDFYLSDFEKSDLKVSYGLEIDGIWKGIKYFKLKYIDEVKVRSILPEVIQNEFDLFVMEINNKIPPHTDSGILSSINIYIESEPCRTQFYSFNENHDTLQIENQTNGKLFRLSNLTLEDSFVAKLNEVWLLDVTKPHSVYPIDENTKTVKRVAICLQSSKYSYDDVKRLITHANKK